MAGKGGGTLLGRVGRRVLRIPVLGKTVSRMLHAAGAERLSAATSVHSGYVPEQVRVTVPEDGRKGQTLQMCALGGKERVTRALWYHGFLGYEEPLPLLYARLASNASVILGVGANSGFYEIVSALVAPSAQIYAFEPFPPAVECFLQNMRANDLEGRVQLIAKAVSDRKGTAQLYVPRHRRVDVLESSASLDSEFRPEHAEVITVETTTIDAFVQEQGLERVDILRMDVENWEHAVLKGSVETLKSMRPSVVLEVLPGAKDDLIEEVRRQVDYRSVRIGKGTLVLEGAVRAHEKDWNHLLWPSERLDELKDLAREARLVLHTEK